MILHASWSVPRDLLDHESKEDWGYTRRLNLSTIFAVCLSLACFFLFSLLLFLCISNLRVCFCCEQFEGYSFTMMVCICFFNVFFYFFYLR
ncbi:hypothetical protein BDZ91DRAFT_727848 [Kalaharituber pfeilii]|nr:hypothetical protein BDZ91DRAFT_727848 [Kalaharituber pfeilii]